VKKTLFTVVAAAFVLEVVIPVILLLFLGGGQFGYAFPSFLVFLFLHVFVTAPVLVLVITPLKSVKAIWLYLIAMLGSLFLHYILINPYGNIVALVFPEQTDLGRTQFFVFLLTVSMAPLVGLVAALALRRQATVAPKGG
jgi:hypothetical protein